MGQRFCRNVFAALGQRTQSFRGLGGRSALLYLGVLGGAFSMCRASPSRERLFGDARWAVYLAIFSSRRRTWSGVVGSSSCAGHQIAITPACHADIGDALCGRCVTRAADETRPFAVYQVAYAVRLHGLTQRHHTNRGYAPAGRRPASWRPSVWRNDHAARVVRPCPAG